MNEKGFTLIEVSVVLGGIVLVLGLLAGWIMNIATIVHTIDLPISGIFILRCVGIFVAPLGAILGWF